jgi:hypothetical protein
MKPAPLLQYPQAALKNNTGTFWIVHRIADETQGAYLHSPCTSNPGEAGGLVSGLHDPGIV